MIMGIKKLPSYRDYCSSRPEAGQYTTRETYIKFVRMRLATALNFVWDRSLMVSTQKQSKMKLTQTERMEILIMIGCGDKMRNKNKFAIYLTSIQIGNQSLSPRTTGNLSENLPSIKEHFIIGTPEPQTPRAKRSFNELVVPLILFWRQLKVSHHHHHYHKVE
ncbi:hypothetical protein NQ317_005390 [Molorchus minor]|uniref:Uncharacterized protein n=1 Tax=Molorchus minor TaxID=1323400 RepID=A0ABQ9IQM7_9CUCU|nr:hypothetical protein NQ317_005390 [Molorchus minor]